jgi:hypothetical protein
MIVIEDSIHAEQNGQFACLAEAVAELQRRAAIPWDKPPNVAPCVSWQTCGREYFILEFDTSQTPWKLLRSVPVLNVSAERVEWVDNFEQAWKSAARV